MNDSLINSWLDNEDSLSEENTCSDEDYVPSPKLSRLESKLKTCKR